MGQQQGVADDSASVQLEVASSRPDLGGKGQEIDLAHSKRGRMMVLEHRVNRFDVFWLLGLPLQHIVEHAVLVEDPEHMR